MSRGTEEPFSFWLKQRRKELDLTQEELASRVGCARSTIRKLEAGTRRPSKPLAQGLLKALDVPTHQQAHFFQLARGSADRTDTSPVVEAAAPPEPLIQLPALLTSLIGRERDVAAVRTRLLQPGVRLLTLVGPPGIGKTRLSLQTAAAMRDDFRDGVVFVALASLNDPALVLPTVARTLGLNESSHQPVFDTLKQFLQPRQMLLVLDNFEQVLEAAAQLSELLVAAPGLKLLVTSRTVLRLYAEHRFVVLPLALPDLQALPPLERLAEVPAIDLFVERAQAVVPEFTLTEQNAAVIADLCVRLDGLPLAIELAAARIELYSVSDLRNQLLQKDSRSSLPLLERDAPDVSPRQQTMTNAIAWSYQLLDQETQQLLRQLAVFVGGFTRTAAESVCGGRLAARGLASLLDTSLLLKVPQNRRLPSLQEDEPRMAMLQVIREFSWQELVDSGEVDAMRRRHLEYFLTLAQTAYPNLEGAETGLWLDRLEEEQDNFRAALSWALDGNAVEPAAELLNMLWWFWHVRGHYNEGRRWLALALAREELAALLRAHLFNAAGVLAWNQADYEQARSALEQSLALHRAEGNRRGIAAVLGNLGIVARRHGDYAYAQKCQEECLAICREEGRPWYTAVALNNLGELARDAGDIRQARLYWEECLALRRELGDLRGISTVLLNLGDAAYDAGHYQRARELRRQARAYLEELGDRSALGQAVRGLGDVARMEGDYEQALTLYRSALVLYEEVGDREGLAACLEAFAGFAAAQRGLEHAARLLGAAETMRQAIRSLHSPADRVHYEKTLALVRAGLNPQALTASWEQGRTLGQENALALALSLEQAPTATDAAIEELLPALTLTAREREILHLLAAGLTNQQIADQLVISPSTVSAHLRSIYDKLGLHSRSAATRFALEHNLA